MMCPGHRRVVITRLYWVQAVSKDVWWEAKHGTQKPEIKHGVLRCTSSNCSPIATVFLVAQLLVSLLLSWVYTKGTLLITGNTLDTISSWFVCRVPSHPEKNLTKGKNFIRLCCKVPNYQIHWVQTIHNHPSSAKIVEIQSQRSLSKLSEKHAFASHQRIWA